MVSAFDSTPTSDQNVNSPHNLNKMSVKEVLTPSFYADYPTKNSMVLVRRMNVSILRIKGLVKEIREDKETFLFRP